MLGQTISHYRIVEQLGHGGMGVVYKALDLRLDRFVALKFLPVELTRDHHASVRFRQEAQAASALDHPNIGTIHEIDETPDHRLFLALAYYPGETLKQRIERGSLPLDEALVIATQIARGLSRAHQSNIVHRDIKPANVILTTEGLVKIVDFGLAKLTGNADVTRTGNVVGTPAYMSPEQARGEPVGPETDVWALGVVLFEMLAGTRPFTGADHLGVAAQVQGATPRPLGEVRPGVPREIQRVVARALSRSPAARYATATELLGDLTAYEASTSVVRPGGSEARRTMLRPIVTIATIAVLLAAAVVVAVVIRRERRARWAREEAIPEIQRRIVLDDYASAFALAREVEAVLPNDPALPPLWQQISSTGDLVATVDGATVFVEPYAAGDDHWELLGQTPLRNIRLPRGVFRFRIEKAGYLPRLLASRIPGNLIVGTPPRVVVELVREGEGAADSVPVAPGEFPIGLSGFDSEERLDLGRFLIDRHEVTNTDFKRFVDESGYTTMSYWRDLPFKKSGRALTAETAIATFTDTTDRPGPAEWELGGFPAGRGQYPVTGVSWYEAVAYCRAAGKTLPTVYHWGRAALSPDEQGQALAPAIVPLSNFGGKGLAPVGAHRGLGPFGTSDMAGNAREWVWNEMRDGRRWVAGGAWNDPDYMSVIPASLPPFDRSAANGFRCASVPSPVPSRLTTMVDRGFRDFRTEKAVSNEVLSVFQRQYAYLPSPLNTIVDSRDDTPADWVREVMSFDAGYEPGRVAMYVFLPKNASPPYQAVIQFTGAGAFIREGKSETLQPNIVNDFIPRGGRALVQVVFKGSYERWDRFLGLTGEQYLSTFRTRMGQWRQDLGHAIDALAARPNKDIDTARIGYFGVSFGASMPLPLLALEHRLKAAVLTSGGFPFRPVPAEADAVNYASHITMPVLLLGGKYDFLFPMETSQEPLMDRLGTPSTDKRHRKFEAGHTGHPRNATISEALAWFDKYLGPVTAAKNSTR